MTPTPAEIEAFLKGMAHARKIAETTERGKVAGMAIRLEETTLRMLNDKLEKKNAPL